MLPSLVLWARIGVAATAIVYSGRENQVNVKIPRIEVGGQDENDLSEHDDLRDETRTNYPLVIDGALATAERSRSLHGDYLFLYQPTPGTVLFLGDGSRADGDPNPLDRFNWQPLRRAADYFFAKYSYLLRL